MFLITVCHSYIQAYRILFLKLNFKAVPVSLSECKDLHQTSLLLLLILGFLTVFLVTAAQWLISKAQHWKNVEIKYFSQLDVHFLSFFLGYGIVQVHLWLHVLLDFLLRLFSHETWVSKNHTEKKAFFFSLNRLSEVVSTDEHEVLIIIIIIIGA